MDFTTVRALEPIAAHPEVHVAAARLFVADVDHVASPAVDDERVTLRSDSTEDQEACVASIDDIDPVACQPEIDARLQAAALIEHHDVRGR
jgi:hypothetical protein